MMEDKTEGTERKEGAYGFVANVREEPGDVIMRLDWLENLLKLSYSITAKRLIISGVVFALPAISMIFLLASNPTRARFLFLPIILLVVVLAGWVILYMFIDPTSGSLISGCLRMKNFIVRYYKTRFGFLSKPRNTKIEKVNSDGIIEFTNGDVGKLYILDGKTSPTAYPDEILAQQAIDTKFHNARNRTTTQITITSSQKQNAEPQRKTYAKEIAMNKHSKSIRDYIELQDTYVSQGIEGRKNQIVQHLLIRDPSMSGLEQHKARLESAARRGMFHSLVGCSKKETEKILKDIFWMR
ncbi:hypothetical protein P9705_001285 [Enterococcus faecalis]|nr:hypothetical protein [Enterococcus faecalis]